MPDIESPYYPIIYVRGYAMTQSEIDATTSTPYMGFNLGTTRIRQSWDSKPVAYIFESPLIRLMKEYKYSDAYENGSVSEKLPPRSVSIFRYYDQADSELGHGEPPTIQEAAKELAKQILELRDSICGDDKEAIQKFKVYLVAHSMGGLIVRCLLQGTHVDLKKSKKLVDKVFTYATPHNGIEMGGINPPKFFSLFDMNNFNRSVIAKFLGMPGKPKRVDSLKKRFDPNRFFCLVGTNSSDYDVASGLSKLLAGEASDGLVKITNAVVQQAPRAYVHRSHSGPHGIVNSEEGYQNLVRFLFGDHQVNGTIEVEALPLPPKILKAKKEGKTVRASYYFETSVGTRGGLTYQLTERRKKTSSAVLRKYDELFKIDKIKGLDKPRSPYMFSVFLNSEKITDGEHITFSVLVIVSATDYVIDRKWFFNSNLPGETLFRKTIEIRVTRKDEKVSAWYNFIDEEWSGNTITEDFQSDTDGLYIPLSSKKGFKGKLRLDVLPWN